MNALCTVDGLIPDLGACRYFICKVSARGICKPTTHWFAAKQAPNPCRWQIKEKKNFV